MLQEFVAEYVEINKVVPNIHFGGCGVFAEQLYDRLKLMGYKPRVVAFTNNIRIFKHRLKLTGDEFVGENRALLIHVAVKVDGYYLDSWGAVTSFENTRYQSFLRYEKMSIDKLREVNELPIWNKSFNRANIKVITKRLDKIYERISSNSLEVTK